MIVNFPSSTVELAQPARRSGAWIEEERVENGPSNVWEYPTPTKNTLGRRVRGVVGGWVGPNLVLSRFKSASGSGTRERPHRENTLPLRGSRPSSKHVDSLSSGLSRPSIDFLLCESQHAVGVKGDLLSSTLIDSRTKLSLLLLLFAHSTRSARCSRAFRRVQPMRGGGHRHDM